MTSKNITSSRLALSTQQVALLDPGQRVARVARLTDESMATVDAAIEEFVITADKQLMGVCAMFSGGNDSTVLTHLFRGRATHAIHANTTIGVEETRQFVREACRRWDLDLLEYAPDAVDQYRALVLAHGFPGPGMHAKMYQRLKERAFHKARRHLVDDGRRQRVLFLAGRRRTESIRRSGVKECDRDGSIVWVSPMVNWTKLDLNTYRTMHGNVPANSVTDLLHMSGECLCGAFARTNELDEIAFWFPAVADEIHELERMIANRDDIPEYRKLWGWGGDPETLRRSRSHERRPTAGRLCGSCELQKP
jgi:3'-phosphoadenosine 5'-phosphosulfate sulfotransferase (PAPS reductase)/FAD synthetase